MDQEPTLFQTVGEQHAAAELSHDRVPELPGYRLDRLVGAGSFGQVWAGIHERTGRKVAVKLLVSSLTSQALRVELDRLRVATDHPSIVDLLDADPDHDPPFLSMPWLGGGTLAEQSRPSCAQAEVWIAQIAEALKSIHAKGILHCDLKPANVLLDDEDRAYLADFGQSLVLGGRSRAWGTVGTMPPEQALLGTEEKNSSPNVSWDIYALGATAYYLLTGALPRLRLEDLRSMSAGSSVEERLEQYREFLASRPLLPIRDLNAEVDRELAYMVEACLHLEPEKRPSTVDEFLLDLERRKNKQPLLCRRPWSAGYQISCWLRRPLVAASVLFAFLAVGGLALGNARLNQANMQLSQANTQLTSTVGQLMESRGDSLLGSDKASILWYAEALKALPEDSFLRRKLVRPALSLIAIKPEAPVAFFQGDKVCFGLQDGMQRGTSTFPLEGSLQLVSSDGRFGLAIKGGNRHDLIAYDLSGTPSRLFEIQATVQHVSPDGGRMTFLNEDLELVLVDRSGTELAKLGRRGRSLGFLDSSTLAYSPDGASVKLWRPDGTRTLAKLDVAPESITRVGPDQVVLITNTESRLLRLSDGVEVSRGPHALGVYRLTEDSLLLTSSDRLEVRHIPTFFPLVSFPQERTPSQVALAPDGSRFAVLNDLGVRLYQADPLQALSPQLPAFGETGSAFDRLQFSADGRHLVSCSKETRIWEVSGRPALFRFKNVEIAGWLNGELVVGAPSDPLQVVRDGRVTAFEGAVSRVSVDGQIWELSDGELHPLLVTRDFSIRSPGTVVQSKRLLARLEDGRIEVMRYPKGETVFSKEVEPGEPSEEYADGLALGPEGDLLAYSDKSDIAIIDMKSGETLRTIAHQGVMALQFDRSGRLLACQTLTGAGAAKDEIVILDSRDEHVVHRFENGRKIAFHPDKDLVLVRDPDDRSEVFSTTSWRPEYSFVGEGWFLPGTGLLVRHTETEIQLLEADSGRVLAAPYLVRPGAINSNLRAITFDPKSSQLAVSDFQKRVVILSIPEPQNSTPEEVERLVQGWTGLALDPRTGTQRPMTAQEWQALSD